MRKIYKSQTLQETHERYMRYAIALGHKGVGTTGSNPSVGCVIVSTSGQIIGVGTTATHGRPHAEPQALQMAGSAALGATVYVTLEPCAHHGQTPPCVSALVAAKVAHVVIACLDPDPRVAGRGISCLQQAGITVTTGVLADMASVSLQGYLMRQRKARPFVTAKIASSMDGCIATSTGQSQWITGPHARKSGHFLRFKKDAIAVGRTTIMADLPNLSCRLPGLESYSPTKVVFDTQGQSWSHIRQWRDAPAPTILFCAEHIAETLQKDSSLSPHVTVQGIPLNKDGLDIPAGLAYLADRQINGLLVEGGASLIASFLKAQVVDQIVWYQAPIMIGGDGRQALTGLGISELSHKISLLAEKRHSFPDGDTVTFWHVDYPET